MTQTVEAPTATDEPQARVDAWFAAFESALAAGDGARAAELFAPACFWRDLVSFTWNIKTVEGRDQVADLVSTAGPRVAATGFATTEPPDEAAGVTTAWFEFETAVGRGTGLLRLTAEGAWTLLTTLDELKGHEEPQRERRPKGVAHGAFTDRETWLEAREREARELGFTTQPEVVIIGGGQGGIALGARLRQLGVPTIIVERNARPGDSWRKRYKSLALHDPVWYDHLPYIDFPKNWPIFSPKDKIGDWLEMYARVMELAYWGSTECKSATYNEAAGEWSVVVERDSVDPLPSGEAPGRGVDPLPSGEAPGRTAEVTLKPKQLVLATGLSGRPRVPDLPGQDLFRGEQHHSAHHPGAAQYAGKRAVIIGSNNSAHDVCAALWEVGADVTMVQRTSTHIVRSDSLMEIGLGDLYSERALAAGVTTRKADLIFASLPYRIMHEFQIPVYAAIKERDQDFYDRLEKAGFRLDWGDDESGLFMKYLRRGSGYYIDVGACELVASGDIKLAHGQVRELTEDSVVLEDGSTLPADLVVYATGYGPMNGWAAELISPEVAATVGKVWGLGSDTTKDPGPWEGEQRNMWKPTQQPGLWFHGGNLHQSRHYSLFLALQLKARAEGIDTPVYGLQEVHHPE